MNTFIWTEFYRILTETYQFSNIYKGTQNVSVGNKLYLKRYQLKCPFSKHSEYLAESVELNIISFELYIKFQHEFSNKNIWKTYR